MGQRAVQVSISQVPGSSAPTNKYAITRRSLAILMTDGVSVPNIYNDLHIQPGFFF